MILVSDSHHKVYFDQQSNSYLKIARNSGEFATSQIKREIAANSLLERKQEIFVVNDCLAVKTRNLGYPITNWNKATITSALDYLLDAPKPADQYVQYNVANQVSHKTSTENNNSDNNNSKRKIPNSLYLNAKEVIGDNISVDEYSDIINSRDGGSAKDLLLAKLNRLELPQNSIVESTNLNTASDLNVISNKDVECKNRSLYQIKNTQLAINYNENITSATFLPQLIESSLEERQTRLAPVFDLGGIDGGLFAGDFLVHRDCHMGNWVASARRINSSLQ